jgi:hypothetical protein
MDFIIIRKERPNQRRKKKEDDVGLRLLTTTP